MHLLQTIKDSIYSPRFYGSLAKQSFASSFGYFFLLALIITILSSIVPIWTVATAGQKEISSLAKNLSNAFPMQLEVKLTHGIVSTNAQEPYSIPMPQNNSSNLQKNLLVIDTKTPYSSEQFNQYDTLAWLTKDALFIQNDTNGIRTIDLSKMSDVTINRATVDSFMTKAAPFIALFAPVVILFVLVGLYIFYIFHLVYLFFLALLIWVLLKFMDKKTTYLQSYKIGLYAITLPFFLEALRAFIHIPNVVFLSTLIALIVVFVNMKSAPKIVIAKRKSKRK